MQSVRSQVKLLLTGLLLCGTATAATENSLQDLYYGEALFYALQENYFDSIVRLDTELAQLYELDQPQFD
ncbi:MAG TPA: hypothetical protein VGL10_02985, partial [Gammaproteobacteria bacterium]